MKYTTKELLTPYGTMRRKDYWCYQIMYILIMTIAFILMGTGEMGTALGLILCLPTLFSCIMIGIKRIRDMGVSGWFYLFYVGMGFIPVAGFILQIAVMCIPTNYLNKESK